jgi:phosphomannomutase / phosphoglucomutase
MKITLGAGDGKKPNIRVLIGILGALLLSYFGWQAWQLYQAKAAEGNAKDLRVQVAQEVDARSKNLLKEMKDRSAKAAVIDAAAKSDFATASKALADGWNGVKESEVISLDLSAAYEDVEKFGFGKLGLIEAALGSAEPQFAIIKLNDKRMMALSSQIQKEGKPLAVALAFVPADELMSKVTSANPGSTYLALRQGRISLAEAGDNFHAGKAELDAVVIKGTNMRVVSAAGEAPGGLFNLNGIGETVLALLGLIGLGYAALVKPKIKGLDPESAFVDPPTPTLAEVTGGKVGAEAIPEAEKKTKPVQAQNVSAPTSVTVDRSIFRAYDIRGVVGKTIDEKIAKLIGQAVGSLMSDKGCRSIVIGRDGRISSPSLSNALIDGLISTGRDVIDIGQVPTPLAYFGAFHFRTGCAISITGSHNPPDYNGFKIVVDGETLSGETIQDLYSRIAENRIHNADMPGQVSQRYLDDDYIERIASDVQIERKLRVVCDAGNGVAGGIAPRLLEAIGAEVEPLFCEVDGTFPHHHPDPSDPHNLQDLIDIVKRTNADVGLAFDGDGDRLGVVTKSGQIIYPDRLLMLFAADVLERNPGACIIYDVKCTGHLATHILRHGGSPLMWKTGHSLIKAKMKETEAELAGEMSGHFFFRERWFGFDDGLYAACRLLEILAANPDEPEEVFATLPQGVSTPELKIEVEEGEQYSIMQQFIANAAFEGARITTIDGLRADWSDGWGLMRASNTTPVLVLRFDAKDEASLQRIQEQFRQQISAVLPDIALPF